MRPQLFVIMILKVNHYRFLLSVYIFMEEYYLA
jgi:hypothetical protein